MLPWLQIYDNTNYGRYLPYFTALLDSLSHEYSILFENGLFAQSMSGKPYSSVAIYIWIESNHELKSKLKSRWIAILKNEKQLLSHTRNVNNINRLRNSVHEHANYNNNTNEKHSDCSVRRL